MRRLANPYTARLLASVRRERGRAVVVGVALGVTLTRAEAMVVLGGAAAAVEADTV